VTIAIDVLAVGTDPGELPGCRLETADDLLGALARLADGGIGLVLLSLELPDEPGVDAVRAIRERAPKIPVLALVANEDEGRRALEAGARDALPADSAPELLHRAIRYAAEIARLEAELDRMRMVDELTGLLNARGLEQLADHHLRMADRSRVPVELVLVRLDMPAGGVEPSRDERDGFVAETAEVLRDVVRGSDVLARIGEDAFCVLLTDEAAGAELVVLTRLVEAVAASNARSGEARELWLSVGAATYDPERPVTFAELMLEAAQGMGRPGASA